MATAIETYAAKVDAAFTAIAETVDSIVTSLSGVAGDVDRLKATIKQLQETPGTITPEDQALLDKSEAAVNQIASRLAGLKEAMASSGASQSMPNQSEPYPNPPVRAGPILTAPHLAQAYQSEPHHRSALRDLACLTLQSIT
jgi:hypothetical protein